MQGKICPFPLATWKPRNKQGVTKGNALGSSLQITEADSAGALCGTQCELSLLWAEPFPAPFAQGLLRSLLPLLHAGGGRDQQHRELVGFLGPGLTYLSWSYSEDSGMLVRANWLDS